ncbi:MAG: UvrD-helicase domain-containing protein [Phycisphaerae bacterium]
MTTPMRQSVERNAPSETDAQKAAIAHRRGEMVVLAGAGSGKTATLASRCAALVTDLTDPSDVRELLVLTFTREAADEMRSRIARAIRQAANMPQRRDAARLREQAALADTAQISTFHAFCHWVAKTWFMFCHVDPGFGVLNEHEAAMLQSDALQETARQWMVAEHPHHSDFVGLFDLYAGAALPKLEWLIEPVLRTAETVVDPDAWYKAAAATGDPEIEKIITALVQQKCQRLKELALMLSANADEARLFVADKKKVMYTDLMQVAKAAHGAAEILRTHGPAGWRAARDIIATETFAARLTLQKAEDVEQAEHFKKGTYQPLKDAFKDMRDELARVDIAQFIELETISRRRIATIVAFAAAVQASYRQAKQARGQLDYSDLERTIIAALTTPDNPLRGMLRQRFRHILVDEYQDINPVQQRLIELLYRGDGLTDELKPGSFFGVGDVLQSIYGFRGSEPRILHNKVTTLQRAGRADKVITMRENFRTLPPLIAALNAVIDPMLRMVDYHSSRESMRMAEFAALRPGRLAPGDGAYPGVPVTLHVLTNSHSESSTAAAADPADTALEAVDGADDDPIAEMQADEKEATKIGQLILEMLHSRRSSSPHGRPIELNDMAILLRAPKQRAPHYVRTLLAMGINANAALTTGFFESGEVLEVLDILRVLDNPEQDIALAGVLLGPVGGCTMADLARIRQATASHIPFHQAVRKLVEHTPANAAIGKLLEKINTVNKTLEHWRAMLRTETLANGLARILREAGLLNRAAAMSQGRQRLANLRLLQQRALEFSGFDLQSLSRFLVFFDRLREERDLGEAAPPTGNAVRVMSIHGCKGLEFPVVFVAALGTRFNERDLRQPLLVDREKGLGLTILDNTGVLKRNSPGWMVIAQDKTNQLLQEEARLLYVAMTRARDQLVLVGRAGQSAVDKWNRAAVPSHSSDGNRRAALKPAKCPLDWLGPIFTQYHSAAHAAPLLVLHITQEDQLANNLTTGREVPPSAPAGDHGAASSAAATSTRTADMAAICNRMTQPYLYAQFTHLPAVTTVSRLKSPPTDDPESPALAMDAAVASTPLKLVAESSGARTGLVMHSVLQRLDLTRKVTIDSLIAASADMVTGGFLTAEERRLVDHDALLWFFATPLGQRLQVAAVKATKEHQLRRELSFLWSIPAAQAARAIDPTQQSAESADSLFAPGRLTQGATTDQTLIRGTIDALLIEPDGVEVIDYKTDAAEFIELRLPAYQRQVGYYAGAASAILHRPVRQTALIFFAARRIEQFAP